MKQFFDSMKMMPQWESFLIIYGAGMLFQSILMIVLASGILKRVFKKASPNQP